MHLGVIGAKSDTLVCYMIYEESFNTVSGFSFLMFYFFALFFFFIIDLELIQVLPSMLSVSRDKCILM